MQAFRKRVALVESLALGFLGLVACDDAITVRLIAPAGESARALRLLAQRAEREPADPALAFTLWEEAFARSVADDETGWA